MSNSKRIRDLRDGSEPKPSQCRDGSHNHQKIVPSGTITTSDQALASSLKECWRAYQVSERRVSLSWKKRNWRRARASWPCDVEVMDLRSRIAASRNDGLCQNHCFQTMPIYLQTRPVRTGQNPAWRCATIHSYCSRGHRLVSSRSLSTSAVTSTLSCLATGVSVFTACTVAFVG